MTKQDSSLEEYKLNAMKREYRYKMGVVAALVFMITAATFVILGYFCAIEIITDSQAKAIDVITSVKDTAEVKTQAQ